MNFNEVKRCDFLSEIPINDFFMEGINVSCVKFRPNLYNDGLFEKLGVEFPEQLQKSVVKRRAEYLAGRWCAINSLSQMGIYDWQISTGEHRDPLWPSDTLGSISHCSDYAIATTSDNSRCLGIGIDIEEIISAETMKNIRSQIINKDEEKLISTLNTDSKEKWFTLCFSAKESFFKAVYPVVKCYFGFEAVSVTGIDTQNSTLQLKLNFSLCPALQENHVFEAYFRNLDDENLLTFVTIPSSI